MFSLDNLLRYEVFPSELPPCFSTSSLADISREAITAATSFTRQFSIPLKYSGYKSESSRRKFALPNPYHYCKAVNIIINNESEISPIFKKSSYSLTAPIDKKAKAHQAYAKKSTCIADTKQEIEMQYRDNRYEIRLDISSFFDSVYTHSIPWAIHTIAVAKKKRTDSSLLGNQLDKCMQAMNYNQTNGILVGNAVSRIISEIILCTLDESIQKKFPNISCRRFVDDYYIYTHDSAQIQEIISFIRTLLAQYELSFNENKIQVNESPFLYGKPWVEQVKQYMHLQPDVLLSKLIMEYNLHKDIAIIKYGLKVIAYCRYNAKNWPAMQSRLINIWVRFPSLAEHIIPILWCNKDKLNKNILKKAVYSVMNESLVLNHEQELIWAVWFAKVFDINLAQAYIGRILKSSNDIAIIILLDYIHAKGLHTTKQIKQNLSSLYDKLALDDKDEEGKPNMLLWTSHWLLAYEADRNKWLNINGKVFDFARKNQFFKVLLTKNVAFYNSFYVYDAPAKTTKNLEYATRSELYSAINRLRKLIEERLKREGEPDHFTLTPSESEIYEQFVQAWEHEESVYIG